MTDRAIEQEERDPANPDPPEEHRRFAVSSRIVRIAGLALLVVPIVLADVWPGHAIWDGALGPVTLVLGDWVPTLREIAAWCLGLGILCVVFASAFGPWGRGAASVIVARLLSPIIIVGTLLLSLGAMWSIWAAQTDYGLVADASPGGCRIVTGSTSAGLHGQNVSVGVVASDERQVRWLLRDAYAEVGRAQLTAVWDGEDGRLVSSLPYQGAQQLEAVRVSCGR